MKGENGGDLICDANKEEEGKKEVLFTRRLRRPGQREPRLGQLTGAIQCRQRKCISVYTRIYNIDIKVMSN